MKKRLVKIPFIIAVLTTDKRLGFYTGNGFDTLKNKAKPYSNKGLATIQAKKFVGQAGVKAVGVYPANACVKTNIINELKANKNPITGSRKRRVTKARTLFKDFTGHSADQYEIMEIPDYDTGLKVGNCVGIMYETRRDGKNEKYLHKFKKASQPAFCVSHDGQQIFLIGGSYLFKDSGINDT